MSWLPAALLALVVGCAEKGELEISTELLAIAATEVTRFPVSATLPTDLRPRADGGWIVLDGYQGQAHIYDAAGTLQRTIGSERTWGHPLRLAPASDGGYWLTAPADDTDAGAVLLVDDAGEVLRALTPHPMPEGAPAFSPVSVEQVGPWLVVSDRAGWVGRMSPEDGALGATWAGAAADEPFGAIADLARGSGGDVWAVDARDSQVYQLGVQGPLQERFGRFGFWAGALYRPKSAVVVEDSVIVADSALGVVQIFSADGHLRGVLSEAGAPLRFQHPLAVRVAVDGALLVLDAAVPEVVRAAVAPGALVAEPDPDVHHLRYTLLEQSPDDPAQPYDACIQCHDGFIRDDRVVWDAALEQHPRELESPDDVPRMFPLDDGGKLVCSSCHSPHGAVPSELANDALAGLPELTRIHAGGTTSTDALGSGALCRACHGEAPHEDAIEKLGIEGGSHPSGKELADAMAKRGADAIDALVGRDCEACHSAHGARSTPLLRDASSPMMCAACHEEQSVVGRNHPLLRSPGSDVEAPRRSALLADVRDGELGCRTCHDLVGGQGDGLVRRPDDGGLLCLACHVEQNELMGAAHRKVRGQDGLLCLGCHDVHGERTDGHMLRIADHGTTGDPQGCLSCHKANGRVAPGKRGHPVDGQALKDGSALTCLTCHSAHDPMESGARCESCHAEQATAKAAGGHGTAACMDCHPAHAQPALASSSDTNPAAARCLACHAPGTSGEATKVGTAAHPTPAFLPDGKRWQPDGKLPLYDASGNPQPAGENGDLVCQSCHVTHGPASASSDNLRREGWQDVCASCHGDDALMLYRYFHDPTRREAKGGAP